jgi:hypothetical protein
MRRGRTGALGRSATQYRLVNKVAPVHFSPVPGLDLFVPLYATQWRSNHRVTMRSCALDPNWTALSSGGPPLARK